MRRRCLLPLHEKVSHFEIRDWLFALSFAVILQLKGFVEHGATAPGKSAKRRTPRVVRDQFVLEVAEEVHDPSIIY